MSYAVAWLPSAQDALLQIVLSRADRADVVQALDNLGRVLARDGVVAGESRVGEFRVLFELPLAVKFTADANKQEVTIVEVWAIGDSP